MGHVGSTREFHAVVWMVCTRIVVEVVHFKLPVLEGLPAANIAWAEGINAEDGLLQAYRLTAEFSVETVFNSIRNRLSKFRSPDDVDDGLLVVTGMAPFCMAALRRWR